MENWKCWGVSHVTMTTGNVKTQIALATAQISAQGLYCYGKKTYCSYFKFALGN